MLNISVHNRVELDDKQEYASFALLAKKSVKRLPLIITLTLVGIAIVALFLPWTQNVQASGYVTTIRPDQKPQGIQSAIAGRIEEWYVQEGELVQAGDTILYLSEVKSEYLNPELIDRTREQVDAKSESIASYQQKVRALEQQYSALQEARELKIKQTQNKILQTRNKIAGDSAKLIALRIDLETSRDQERRIQNLYDKGLKSLTQLQEKQLKTQESIAKVTEQENKLLALDNELINLRIELSSVRQEYADKLAKSRSDRATALSNQLDATSSTAKLRDQLQQYQLRNELYYITAPQTGYIAQAVQKGLGEVLKEGEDIVTILPDDVDLAVEVYVSPRDLPLLQRGNPVRLQFDGWPAIVFSGWPNASFGVFNGRIVAIDQFTSDNGKYRVLVSPDSDYKEWPDLIRIGSGVRAFILLEDVPLWYELWRQLNGFPANFYQEKSEMEKVKRKEPLRSVK